MRPRRDPPTDDPIAYLAHCCIGWPELLITHRAGPAAAVAYIAGHEQAGCGIGHDGVFRNHHVHGRRASLRIGSLTAEPITTTTRTLINWAMPRFAPTDWDDLTHLERDRNTALRLIQPDVDAWRKQTYRPSELTADDHARIRRGHQARFAAEDAMEHLVHTRLTEPVARPGEQLDLFAPT